MSGTRSSSSGNIEGNELAEIPRRRLPDEEAHLGETRDPNSQATLELESKNDKHDLPNEISFRGFNRLWQYIKAKTGYKSYFDYLEDCHKDYPHADSVEECFSETWMLWGNEGVDCQTYAIFDLQVGPSSCPGLDLRSTCSSESAGTVISALHHPLLPSGTRILLWEASVLSD